MTVALSAPDRTRLVRLLGMLGSNAVGERANAGSLADRLIRERGMTWDQVITGDDGPRQQGQQDDPRRQRQPRTWRGVIADCRAQPERLSSWEASFLASVGGWHGRLTLKQQAKLTDIAERLGVELPA